MSGAFDLRPALPSLVVTVTALAALLAQAFSPRSKRAPAAGIALFGLAAAAVVTVLLRLEPGPAASLGGSLVADGLSLYLHLVILGVAVAGVLLSPGYLRSTRCERGEYYALLLFSTVGMLGLVSTTELVSLFVALEIMSVALYALSGFHRDRDTSQEAALKYFITGAFSSALFLYGAALLYGLSGTTRLDGISAKLTACCCTGPGDAGPPGLALAGVGLLLVGLGFKVASAPFHMWAPDVYEGAPTSVTAFMSAGVKVAAFGAALRILGEGVPSLAVQWRPVVAVLALLSMVVGNLGALAQSSLKRMLAYSSVAHAGYLLTALVAGPMAAAEAVLFYLVAYGAVSLGTFGAIAALHRDGREPASCADVAGLATRRPALAAALALFLISLIGVPVSAGFIGKLYLFKAAVGAGYTWLAVVGVVMSVVSAFYYLRVVVAMYMESPVGDDPWAALGLGERVALAAQAAVVLGLGLFPDPLVRAARAAALALL
jgi:NADH-quinone oxidoreductase subunit N